MTLFYKKQTNHFLLYMIPVSYLYNTYDEQKRLTTHHGQKQQNIYSFPGKTNEKFGPILGFIG